MTRAGKHGLLAAFLVALSALGCARKAPPQPRAPSHGLSRFGTLPGAPDPRHWPDSARPPAEAQVVAVEAGVAGDRIATLLEVPEDMCAVVIGRATGSVEDLDLLAYGEDGAALGTDEGPDKTPALLICPPHPRRIYVAARIASGHGMVALGAQRVAPKDAERVAGRYNAKNRAGEANLRLKAWPGLDEQLALHRESIGGKWLDVRRVAMPLDSRIPSRISAPVDAESCLDALIVPSDEVSHLDVAALDERGRVVGRAAARGRERSLVICSPTTAQLTLEIRPHAGRGLAVVMLSRSAPGSPPDIDAQVLRYDLFPNTDLKDVQAKHATRLAALGYGGAKVVTRGTLAVGRRTSVPLELAAGCSRLDVLGANPTRGVEAWLWSADGKLIGNEQGGGRATLFACSKGGPARLDVEAMMNPGPFAVELRPESETPPLLNDSGLAAGRLLSRMTANGVIKGANGIGAVKRFALTPTQLQTMDIVVPVDRCVDVSMGLGRDVAGAELRIVDGKTGEEIALARGTHAVSARACALESRSRGTLNARVELRVSAGSGEGLVATRLLSPMN